MVNKQWQHRQKLVLGQLVAERVQVFNGIDLKNGLCFGCIIVRLKVLKHMIGEKLDHVNESIGRGHTMLHSGALCCNRS